MYHLLYRFTVFFFCNISLTRCIALMNMIIQTRPVLSYIFWKVSITASDMIYLSQKINRILHRSSTRIGSKIFCLIFDHSPHHHDTRICFCDGYFYERICFVIHQHGIVFRPVFFNKITLQYKRFQLGICHDIFKTSDMGHHLFNLNTFISAGLKILTHTILQTDCLAHIYNVVLFIMHKIDAWFGR